MQLTRIPFGIYTGGKHRFVYFKQEEQELSVGSLDLYAFNLVITLDKLYGILNRANDWIDRHLPYFYTTEKALLELNQLYLFDNPLNK